MWLTLYCAFVALIQPFFPIPCVPEACHLLHRSLSTQATLLDITFPTSSPFYYFDAATVHFLKLKLPTVPLIDTAPQLLLLDAPPIRLSIDASPHWPRYQYLDFRVRKMVELDRMVVGKVSNIMGGALVDTVRFSLIYLIVLYFLRVRIIMLTDDHCFMVGVGLVVYASRPSP